ncbi:hypothetical protein GCM10009570_24970 [Dietzia natronolimnaea]
MSAACSSGESAGGVLSGGGREVIAGEECLARTDIHNIGTYSPVSYDTTDPLGNLRPFPDLIINRDGLQIHDGLASEEQAPFGTRVEPSTLSKEQNAQLDESYKELVNQISQQLGTSISEFQNGHPPVMPDLQNGIVVLYGEDLTSTFKPWSENEELYTDGVADSEDLHVCVGARTSQGDISSSQYIR